MFQHLRANLWLFVFSVVICCVAYPAVLLGIGQLLFRDQANGSLVYDKDGNPIGSRMMAQPFIADEYFQPRPSSVSYNASASGASNWAANNPALRNRVARQLGPIVKYAAGAKKGQLAAGDIEAWFQKDEAGGKPGIVAQWADAHNAFAQGWVGTTYDDKKPTPQQQYVLDWAKAHPDVVAKFKQDNPDNQAPSPADLAVVFFETFSKEHPGKFPAVVTKTDADGKSTSTIEPIAEGTDIQSTFFDMWLNEHPDVALEQVPADMVMASGSGLDPDITLDNALWQLDRVAAAWAKKTSKDEAQVRGEIEKLLRSSSSAPLGGAVGVPLINVLETNLALHAKYDKG
jgi:potassium-transporting ATPase KdpC subunit